MFYVIDHLYTINCIVEKYLNITVVSSTPALLLFPLPLHTRLPRLRHQRTACRNRHVCQYLLVIGAGGLYGLGEGLKHIPSRRFRVKLNSVLFGLFFRFCCWIHKFFKPTSHQKSVLRSNTYLRGKLLPAKQTDVISVTI